MAEKSTLQMAAMILVIIGGLNWGIIGLTALIGSGLNVVNLIFGQWAVVENIIYLLVGISAAYGLYLKSTGKM